MPKKCLGRFDNVRMQNISKQNTTISIYKRRIEWLVHRVILIMIWIKVMVKRMMSDSLNCQFNLKV